MMTLLEVNNLFMSQSWRSLYCINVFMSQSWRALYCINVFMSQSWRAPYYIYLQLWPLYPADTAHGVAPSQLCAKHELRLCQLVGAVQVNLLLHLLPARDVRRAVQPVTQTCAVIRTLCFISRTKADVSLSGPRLMLLLSMYLYRLQGEVSGISRGNEGDGSLVARLTLLLFCFSNFVFPLLPANVIYMLDNNAVAINFSAFILQYVMLYHLN
jgi:hypothetical protein